VTRRQQPKENWLITPSHEPIISRGYFDMVQEKLDKRSNRPAGGSPRSKWLFTGLLRCGLCGGSMQIETGGGRSKRYSYYNCRNNQKKGECERHTIRADQLDAWLIESIAENIYTPRFLAEIIVALNKGAENFHEKHAAKVAQASARLNKAIERRERIYDDIEERRFPVEVLRPRIIKADSKVKALESELDWLRLHSAPPSRKLTEDDAEEIRAFMIDTLVNPSNPQRIREYLQVFIESIVLEREDVVINYYPEAIVATGGDTVHSRAGWLPDRSLLGTSKLKITLPRALRRAA